MNASEEFQVYPPIKKILTMTKFTYNIIEIKLFEYVRIIVYLYNDNSLMIDTRQYVIDGEQYKAWSTDDTYILKIIKKKLQEPWII